MPRPVDKYVFDHPEIWEHNNQARFDREPTFLAEVFRRHGSVQRVLDVHRALRAGGLVVIDLEHTSLDGTRLVAVAQKA